MVITAAFSFDQNEDCSLDIYERNACKAADDGQSRSRKIDRVIWQAAHSSIGVSFGRLITGHGVRHIILVLHSCKCLQTASGRLIVVPSHSGGYCESPRQSPNKPLKTSVLTLYSTYLKPLFYKIKSIYHGTKYNSWTHPVYRNFPGNGNWKPMCFRVIS